MCLARLACTVPLHVQKRQICAQGMRSEVMSAHCNVSLMCRVQEADECAEEWSEPDSQPALHTLVVAHHQPCQRVRGLPSAAGSDRHIYARQGQSQLLIPPAPPLTEHVEANFVHVSQQLEICSSTCHRPLHSSNAVLGVCRFRR